MSELAKALAELQKELPHIGKDQRAVVKHKDGEGQHSYDYADLTAISAEVMPLLGKHGLAFMAKPTLKDGQFVLAYSLLHVSGDREDGEFPLSGNNAQAIGSAITYARRYVLCAVTGVAPGGSDDDGKAATEYQRQQPAPVEPTYSRGVDEVKAAWTARHPWDADALAQHFAQWSNGEDIRQAHPDRLKEYAIALAAEPEAEQPTLPENGEAKA